MKRYIICAVALLFLLAGGYYLLFFEGYYLQLDTDAETEVPFKTGEKSVMILRDDEYEELLIKGVDVGASMPGSYHSDYAPEKEDYMRWFEAIGAMGANTVRVSGIMDADFYDALYAYNREKDEPLYLLQGIQVTDAANYGSGSGYSDQFMGSLIEDGLTAVDVIHGRRVTSRSGMIGAEAYFSDVSPWVIGYLVGSEWSPDTIVYTDHSAVHDNVYEGTYFSTSAEATPFEAMLAEVMDRIILYEDSKYHAQRLIGFVSAPDVDFLVYEETSARLYDKYAYLDAEHVLPGEKLVSGYYAAYRLFDYCRDFTKHLSAEQRAELEPMLSVLEARWANAEEEPSYGGYLDLMSEYHTMPVIAAGYGFSSARGVIRGDEKPLTEEEQGEALMRVWRDSVEAEWAGVFLSTWQDHWERRTWNVSFAAELTNNLLWHDVQCDGQNYGLMAYMPLDGENPENTVCLLDGDSAEWEGDEPVLESGGMKLYARGDREYLYLMIQGDGVQEGTKLYLPVDMIDGQGSAVYGTPEIEFGSAADFLLCLDGRENSRLLVHERYDAMRENFAYDIERIDPFVRTPDEDSEVFSTASMAVTMHIPAEDVIGHTDDELRALNAFAAYPTGELTHGCGDPSAENYNSLADFCYGTECVEIRIPWLLLNVADPTEMLIHEDYYENYGVEFTADNSWLIGLGDGAERIEMTEMELDRLPRRIRWEERLKQSYYVVQDEWK